MIRNESCWSSELEIPSRVEGLGRRDENQYKHEINQMRDCASNLTVLLSKDLICGYVSIFNK